MNEEALIHSEKKSAIFFSLNIFRGSRVLRNFISVFSGAQILPSVCIF